MAEEPGPTQGRRFEPPPWEREQFEQLARKRAEEEAARLELERARQLAAEAAEEAARVEREAEDARAASEVVAPETDAPRESEVGPAADDEQVAGGHGLDERRVQAMLVQLSGEEVHALRPVKRASKVFAGVVAAFGTVLVVLGMIAGVRGRGSGVAGMGALVVGIVGAFIAGVAIWLWIRTDKK